MELHSAGKSTKLPRVSTNVRNEKGKPRATPKERVKEKERANPKVRVSISPRGKDSEKADGVAPRANPRA